MYLVLKEGRIKLNIEKKENDTIEKLTRDGRFIPFLDRTEENILSISVKYLINFLAAIIQTVNFPLLILGLFVILETIIKWFADKTFTFENKLNWLIYLMGGYILLLQILQKTHSNIISPHINLIWAVNFKGTLKNRFQSLVLMTSFNVQ